MFAYKFVFHFFTCFFFAFAEVMNDGRVLLNGNADRFLKVYVPHIRAQPKQYKTVTNVERLYEVRHLIRIEKRLEKLKVCDQVENGSFFRVDFNAF